jgi:hypothetical protein
MGELQHEHVHLQPNVLTRFQERRREQIGVEKVRIPVPSLGARFYDPRKPLDGDSFRHLEAESEIRAGEKV